MHDFIDSLIVVVDRTTKDIQRQDQAVANSQRKYDDFFKQLIGMLSFDSHQAVIKSLEALHYLSGFDSRRRVLMESRLIARLFELLEYQEIDYLKRATSILILFAGNHPEISDRIAVEKCDTLITCLLSKYDVALIENSLNLFIILLNNPIAIYPKLIEDAVLKKVGELLRLSEAPRVQYLTQCLLNKIIDKSDDCSAICKKIVAEGVMTGLLRILEPVGGKLSVIQLGALDVLQKLSNDSSNEFIEKMVNQCGIELLVHPSIIGYSVELVNQLYARISLRSPYVIKPIFASCIPDLISISQHSEDKQKKDSAFLLITKLTRVLAKEIVKAKGVGLLFHHFKTDYTVKLSALMGLRYLAELYPACCDEILKLDTLNWLIDIMQAGVSYQQHAVVILAKLSANCPEACVQLNGVHGCKELLREAAKEGFLRDNVNVILQNIEHVARRSAVSLASNPAGHFEAAADPAMTLSSQTVAGYTG